MSNNVSVRKELNTLKYQVLICDILPFACVFVFHSTMDVAVDVCDVRFQASFCFKLHSVDLLKASTGESKKNNQI